MTAGVVTSACCRIDVMCLKHRDVLSFFREPSDDEPVPLRRRASDPPSLSSLHTPDGEFVWIQILMWSNLVSDQTRCWQWSLQRQTHFSCTGSLKLLLLLLFISGGSEETRSCKQWGDCLVSGRVWWLFHCWCIVCRLWFLCVINPENGNIFMMSFFFLQKKHKVKLSKDPETLSAPSLAQGIPQITVGPLGLETGPRPDGRDVMSDGSSEGSSQADETPFCGIATCARLCEALPAPKGWTRSRSQHQRGSRRSQHHRQPPQCSGPPPGSGPALDRLWQPNWSDSEPMAEGSPLDWTCSHTGR